jgi:cytochrome P450
MVPKAKKWVAAGNEPRCMLERWALSIFETAKEQGIAQSDVFGCSNDDIGRTVLDFLFAAQDATNSALTYAADCLEAHPDVMEKMAAEIDTMMGPDAKDVWIKLFAETDNIPYTQKVSNQLLHHKPPVPMIPHLTLKSSNLGKHFIPQGAVVIPSLFYAARESESSIEFLPEREDQDTQFMKCMTFGGGQHKCPGRRYAEVQLTVFLALVANNYRFERIGDRPHQDDFIYFPTLFPNRNEYIVKAIRS